MDIDETQTLTVRVITPKELLFEGLGISVSSVNSLGKFDILPQHANFITLVENQPIRIRQPKTKKSIYFHFLEAIIYNSGSHVTIYAEPQSI